MWAGVVSLDLFKGGFAGVFSTVFCASNSTDAHSSSSSHALTDSGKLSSGACDWFCHRWTSFGMPRGKQWIHDIRAICLHCSSACPPPPHLHTHAASTDDIPTWSLGTVLTPTHAPHELTQRCYPPRRRYISLRLLPFSSWCIRCSSRACDGGARGPLPLPPCGPPPPPVVGHHAAAAQRRAVAAWVRKRAVRTRPLRHVLPTRPSSSAAAATCRWMSLQSHGGDHIARWWPEDS